MTGNNNNLLESLLEKAKGCNVACILLSNEHTDQYGLYEIAAGFGEKEAFYSPDEIKDLDSLKFGFISYDFKNKIEKLNSKNPSAIPVPDFYFFSPEHFFISKNNADIQCNFRLAEGNLQSVTPNCISAWKGNTSDDEYLENIECIKSKIVNGDFYELNYCTQFQSEAFLDPYHAFLSLNKVTQSPFAAFFKFHDLYLLCASPERFLCFRGGKLTSQPIKGTIHRGANAEEDNELKQQLKSSIKDVAENVMIADLVRNDLSRVCIPGTVSADSICEVKTYSHVHQLVSTISGVVKPGVDFNEIIRATFPMGSMTGAPKIKVMETIDEIEDFQRGWYSGSVGIIQDGAFDLNVVIRSVQYDAVKNLLVYNVGGAITFDSSAAEELMECRTKAAGIHQALGGND